MLWHSLEHMQDAYRAERAMKTNGKKKSVKREYQTHFADKDAVCDCVYTPCWDTRARKEISLSCRDHNLTSLPRTLYQPFFHSQFSCHMPQ